jgi:hypothetical protein
MPTPTLARTHGSRPLLPTTTWLLELLDAVGSRPVGAARRQCPAHPDSSPSLSVGDGRTGSTVLHCHAGCPPERVLESLDLGWAQLWRTPAADPRHHARRLRLAFPGLTPSPGTGTRTGNGRGYRLESLHAYGDRYVLERWRHPVTGAKRTFWAARDAGGVLVPGLRDERGDRVPVSRLPLYLEPDVRMAVAARERIVVAESESSVDALVRAGITATTWAGGAARPNLRRLAEVLHSADVLLVPDHDPPGLECGRRIWWALRPRTARLAWLLPGPGQDARDLLRERAAAFRPGG